MEEEVKIAAVERTMAILECIASRESTTQVDIAKALSLNKSTVFRFLTTLCNLGYVTKEANGQYQLSLKMNNFFRYESISGILHSQGIAELEKIADICKETCHLANMKNNKIYYLYKIESTQILRVCTTSYMGAERPLYCTALGKVILAYKMPAIRDEIINGMEFLRFTEHTITNKSQLLTELDQIREQGFAVDNGEHELEVMCFAVPILDQKKNPVAAMSISGPDARMLRNKDTYVKLLKDGEKNIEYHIDITHT